MECRGQAIERVLKPPQFRELRTVRPHAAFALDDADDDDDPPADDDPDGGSMLEGVQDEEEREGEEAADMYMLDNGIIPEGRSILNPMDLVRRHTDVVEGMGDRAASTATGINDFTGFDARREQTKAKGEAAIALSMDLSPDDAAYLSGATPEQVEEQKRQAEEKNKEEEKEEGTF